MQQGFARREKSLDADSMAQRSLEEAIASICDFLGESPEILKKMWQLGILATVNYELPSRFDSGISSDDKLSIVWYREMPTALVLETRDEHNFSDIISVRFAPHQ